ARERVAAVRQLEPSARLDLRACGARVLRRCRSDTDEEKRANDNQQRASASHAHKRHRYEWRNWSMAVLVMRHWVPIFLPLRSPESRLATTSDSATPSSSATCAGVIKPAAPEGGAAGAGPATPVVACPPMIPPG